MVIFEKEIFLGFIQVGTLVATTESVRDGKEYLYRASISSGKAVDVTSSEENTPHEAFITIVKSFIDSAIQDGKVPADIDTVYLYIIKS